MVGLIDMIGKNLLFDKTKIKILDGIAGSAKSSGIDKIMKENGILYGRYTSTNKLKNDAKKRYGGNNYTIAGGLFKTVEMEFYSEEKKTEFDTVVIDEILQTNTKVFKWCEENVGKKNIIICTDSHQMLSPYNGETMLHKYNEFCDNDYCVKFEMHYTFRPVNETTRKLYNYCFDRVMEDCNLWKQFRSKLNRIKFEEMPFSHDNTYICHTNDIEEELYKKFDIGNDYTAELIPKGGIASKEDIDVTRYPILPQNAINGRQMRYLQPANIGTVTRYQGSEVEPGHKLYFMVEKYSNVSNREFYTMITRAKDMADIVIVLCNIAKPIDLTEFDGKPVLKRQPLKIENVTFKDKTDIEKYKNEKGEYTIPEDKMKEILYNNKQQGKAYFENFAYIDGTMAKIESPKQETDGHRPGPTLFSLYQKEPEAFCKFMPNFMQAFEAAQKQRFSGRKLETDSLLHCTIKDTDKPEEEYEYGLDLCCSYPSIMKNEPMPDGRTFYSRDDFVEDDCQHTQIKTSGIDFYYIPFCEGVSEGIVATGEFVRYMQNWRKENKNIQKWQKSFSDCVAIYIGSFPAYRSKVGQYIYDMEHKDVETKKKFKQSLHYGWLNKPFIEANTMDRKGNVVEYVMNENQVFQMIYLHIKSVQCMMMMKIKEKIYGNHSNGRTHEDCEYFNYDGDVVQLGKEISEMFPGYDFRIFKTETKEVVYKTYEELKTKKEIKKEKDRERRRK